MNLVDYRNEIDQIDLELLNLLTKRMGVSKEVAKYKKATGGQVYVPEREQEKIGILRKQAGGLFDEYEIGEIFAHAMCKSRRIQYAVSCEKASNEMSDRKIQIGVWLKNSSGNWNSILSHFIYNAIPILSIRQGTESQENHGPYLIIEVQANEQAASFLNAMAGLALDALERKVL